MSSFYDFLLCVGSVLFVVFALGFCIFIHEFGHFLAAKWRGLHVDAFALGFRPFWRKTYRGVEYRLGYLPFGGYCEIPQIDATGDVPKSADGRELPRAKALDRIVTAVAGPGFNLLSGLLISIVVWAVGIPQVSPKMREMTVRAIDPTGPEYAAGLRVNDRIVEVNGKSFQYTWKEFLEENFYAVDQMELTFLRNGEKHKIVYRPRPNSQMENIAAPSFAVVIPIELVPECGGIAEKAGIRAGDIVIAVNGKEIRDFSDFQLALNRADGKAAEILVRRGDAEKKITVCPKRLSQEGGAMLMILMTDKGNRVEVQSADPDGPAARAGITPGSTLTRIGGKTISTFADVYAALENNHGTPVEIVWENNGRTFSAEVTPEYLYPCGIDIQMMSVDHPTPWAQLVGCCQMSWRSLRGIAIGIGHKFGWTEKQSSLKVGHMSGPLGIGMVLYDSVRHGSIVFALYFVVMISFALALFNLLPLPVLDGGHILFGAIEAVFRRPLPTCVIRYISYLFMILLLALMVFVTFADGKRFYHKYIPVESKK
ncbi:MAG: site-2 protease family protein [Victivallaceae bacterium]|nr:site-2 protease family protein [Victivallaceae bacterium]